MKKTILLIIVAAASLAPLGAETKPSTGMSFGFTLNEYVDDFGLGVQITSPFLFNAVGLRLTGTTQFSRSDWSPWWTVQAGLVGTSGLVAGFARFYGEGGAVLAFPSASVSSAFHAWGGYGHFGFEFFTAEESPIAYYIEAGATGSGLTADKAGGALILNGFRIQVGFRGYPWRK